MKIKVIICLCVATVLSQSVFSQRKDEKESYVVYKNSTYRQGKVEFLEKTWNSVKFTVSGSEEAITIDAKDVIEIGLKDGRVYFSKEVEYKGYVDNILLRRLVGDNPTLYGVKNQLYLEVDSDINKLSKDNYLDLLETYCIACRTGNCRNLQFSKSAIVKYINNYTKNDCNSIPATQFGVFFGFDFMSAELSPSIINTQLTIRPSSLEGTSWSTGLIIEREFAKNSRLMTSAEIRFGRNVQLSNLEGPTFDQDIQLTNNYLEVKPGFNYKFQDVLLKPYFGTGPLIRQNIGVESRLQLVEIHQLGAIRYSL